MQAHSVFWRTLRDQRWQIIGFALAMALMSSTTVWLWPSVRDTLANLDLPDAIQALLGSDLNFATAAGYLSGRYFAWTIMLVVVYVVIAGTGAIAGEESAGTMDVLLAQPVPRRAVLLEKVAGIVLATAIIIAGGFVGFVLSIPTVRIDIALVDVAIACANMLPICLLFLTLSLWAGAVAPNRGTAAGVVIALTTASYFVYTLSNGMESLQGLRYATPFYYYGAGLPLVNGIVWWHVAVLLVPAGALMWLTLRTFERRDVSAGGATDLSAGSVMRRIVARRTGV